MKKRKRTISNILYLGLLFTVSITLNGYASEDQHWTNQSLASEYEALLLLRSHSPALFETALDVNYVLSTKCDVVLPVKLLFEVPTTHKIMAMRLQAGEKDKAYFEQVQNMECAVIQAEMSDSGLGVIHPH